MYVNSLRTCKKSMKMLRNLSDMINRINNIICFVIVAAAFAMIGIESSAHHKPTHSGTQEYVRH